MESEDIEDFFAIPDFWKASAFSIGEPPNNSLFPPEELDGKKRVQITRQPYADWMK
jgi:hypothetical protein